jgi:ribosome-associated heat shock protein Hsp15
LGQRLDKWLVYARFAKHRSTAAALIEAGKVRLNHQRVSKCHQTVKIGDVLTVAVGPHIKVAKILAEAERRGSATVASQLYQDLSSAEKADATTQTVC